MSDAGFDARLERLFAEPPRVADPDGFARRVDARLDREWTLKRWFIGAAGAAGGLVAATQSVGSEAYDRLAATAGPLGRQMQTVLGADWSAGLQTESLMSGPSVWAMVAIGGLLATLAAVRAAEAL